MKHAKFFNFFVLSTALLWSGLGERAQAQSSDSGLIEIIVAQVPPVLTISTTDVNFGTFRQSAESGSVVLSCPSTTTSQTTGGIDLSRIQIAAGDCGRATITTDSATEINFRAEVSSGGFTSDTRMDTSLQIYKSDGSQLASGETMTISSASSVLLSIGVLLVIEAVIQRAFTRAHTHSLRIFNNFY